MPTDFVHLEKTGGGRVNGEPSLWLCGTCTGHNIRPARSRIEVRRSQVHDTSQQPQCAPIHFPFVAKAGDGVHVIAKGTPLVQVIAFKRDGAELRASIRPETDGEAAGARTILRQTQSQDGWYREHARARR